MSSATDKIFIHSAPLDEYPYPESCPFKTCRAGKVRQMLHSMGLLTADDRFEVAPCRADRTTLLLYHSSAYLDALVRINEGQYDMEMLYMGLGTGDCPAFRGVYDYAAGLPERRDGSTMGITEQSSHRV